MCLFRMEETDCFMYVSTKIVGNKASKIKHEFLSPYGYIPLGNSNYHIRDWKENNTCITKKYYLIKWLQLLRKSVLAGASCNYSLLSFLKFLQQQHV